VLIRAKSTCRAQHRCDGLARRLAVAWFGRRILMRASTALAASAVLLLTCAAAASAGTLKLTAGRQRQTYLVTASGTYTEFPSEIDVYVQHGAGACAATDKAEDNLVQEQVQTLGTNAAAAPIEAELGTNLVTSGSYSQQFYWGVDAPSGTYMACAYLLGPQPGPAPQPNPPYGQPADPPEATGSARMQIGTGPSSPPRSACTAQTRSSCKLEILDNAKVVTDATTKVAVGERIALEARFADDATPASPKWSGIAKPDAIESYTFEDTHARTTDLRKSNLRSANIAFYWIHGRTYIVKVRAPTRRQETGRWLAPRSRWRRPG
jgi:hypothetical protein